MSIGAAVAALALVATGASAAELVTNGDFGTGDFTGWTSYTTANGVLGESVSSFDVTGGGASLAATFRVGDAVFSGIQEGGGIFQSITTVSGLLSFSTNFASLGGTLTNSSGGVFSVLLDGITLDSFDTGSIGGSAIERGTLNFSTVVTAGSHVLTLQATRPFTVTTTPFQYFDNVSAVQDGGGGAIPEPQTWALMITGFGLAGGLLRRRDRVALRA